MWLRSARFPLLIAWLIVLGTVAYLWTHPRLIAPFAARLISRNLLREVDGKLRFQDFQWRYLHGFDLYRVSISLRREGGALTLISVDTLSVNYRLGEIFSTRPRLRWVAAKGGEVYVLGGQETRQKKKPSKPPPPRHWRPVIRSWPVE